jgi:DNA repair protein RecO (recombination protein O)
MLTKDLAICIRAVDFSETSQVVTFFARDTGKISAIAKGSKRPKSAFDGPIEVFAFGEIVFSDTARDKLATLTEFQQQPSLAHLAKDLFALHCCLFAAELLNGMTDDYDPHPQLFESFLQFLKDTRVTRHEPRGTISLLILFQLTLLKEAGVMPIWDYCVNCKTRYSTGHLAVERGAASGEVYFSSSANGLVCRDCEPTFPDKVRLTKEAAACLANLRKIPEAAEKTLREIEKILVRHFTELLGRPPKMAKHVLK